VHDELTKCIVIPVFPARGYETRFLLIAARAQDVTSRGEKVAICKHRFFVNNFNVEKWL
jgi:hypothetical protein